MLTGIQQGVIQKGSMIANLKGASLACSPPIWRKGLFRGQNCFWNLGTPHPPSAYAPVLCFGSLSVWGMIRAIPDSHTIANFAFHRNGQLAHFFNSHALIGCPEEKFELVFDWGPSQPDPITPYLPLPSKLTAKNEKRFRRIKMVDVG